MHRCAPASIDARALKEADDWLEEYRRLWEERLDRLDDYLKTLQAAQKAKQAREKLMAAKNNLDLERDPRSIIGTRIFDAPRDLVFSAFTDPKHLAQWWGPDGFTTTTHYFRLSPGGVWRFVMHGPDGRDYQNRITYDEIVPPERIVYHHGGGDDVEPVQFSTTVIFEDLGNGQTRLTWHGQFPSAEARARVIKDYGADKGLVQTMARLDEYVATTGISGARVNVQMLSPATTKRATQRADHRRCRGVSDVQHPRASVSTAEPPCRAACARQR